MEVSGCFWSCSILSTSSCLQLAAAELAAGVKEVGGLSALFHLLFNLHGDGNDGEVLVHSGPLSRLIGPEPLMFIFDSWRFWTLPVQTGALLLL